MKHTKIYLFRELLITQMNYLVFYPFAMTLASLFRAITPEERPSLLIWMLGGLVTFALYLCRRYINHFVPLLIAHIAAVGIQWGLSFVLSPNDSIVNRCVFIIIGICFAIYSFYLRLTTDTFEDQPMQMPFTVGFAAVALFLQHYQDNKAWDNYYKLALIIVVALYFIQSYIKEYLNFLTVNASSTGILPEQQIFSSGIRMTLLYTLAGVVILFCTAQYSWLKQILSAIKQVIYTIIRFIFTLFPIDTTTDGEVFIDEKMSGEGGLPLPEGGEAGLFWKILEVVAVVAIILVLIIAVIIAIKNFIAYVKKMMQKSARLPKEINTLSAVDVREKCEINKKKEKEKRGLGLFGFLDSKERIRRIYKKTVQAYKPSPLMATEKQKKDDYNPDKLPFYTAREMEDRIGASSFAAIYEKARYSNEDCTAQDVKLMKDACRS